MKNLLEQAFEAGKLWERYQFREIDSALDFETWFEQNCIKHDVSGKQPICYCQLDGEAIRAASASGAVDTGAEGEVLYCFCANGGREGLHGICTNCGNWIARSSHEGQP